MPGTLAHVRYAHAVLRPWSRHRRLRSHAWRIALACTAVALPLHVHADSTGAGTPGPPLQQPARAQVASALDRAAENALPSGYPALYGVPRVPAGPPKAIALEENHRRQVR